MACKYPAPVFNRKVSVQSPGGTADAYGERSTTWTTVATVWAAIMPIASRDLIAAGALHGEVTHRVQLRHSSSLAALDGSWRLLYGSRVLVIVGPPRNINEGNRIIELTCAEGLRTE